MVVRRYDVVVIGNAIVDLMRRCSEEFLSATGAVKGHMNMVKSSSDIARLLGCLPHGIDVAGGSAANTAVGISSLGGRAAFIGRIAEDQNGRTFRHDIGGVGVTFQTLAAVAPDKETSHSLILITPDGQRTMNTFLGCSAEIDASLIDPELIRNSKILYLEGYLLDSPSALPAVQKAMAIASAAGVTVALSLSDSLCVERHRPLFMDLIRAGVGILIANEEEVVSLYETTNFDDAVRCVGTDVAMAVLTRSEKGSVIVSKGAPIQVAPEKVSKIVDATGAGDIYAAGLLFGLSRGMDFKAAGRLASAVASEIIGQVGARPEVRLSHLVRMRGLMDAVR